MATKWLSVTVLIFGNSVAKGFEIVGMEKRQANFLAGKLPQRFPGIGSEKFMPR